jgi:hypothetical protein
LTLAPGANPQSVLKAVVANGHFVVDRFEMALPTLDEIFVQIVRNKLRPDELADARPDFEDQNSVNHETLGTD